MGLYPRGAYNRNKTKTVSEQTLAAHVDRNRFFIYFLLVMLFNEIQAMKARGKVFIGWGRWGGGAFNRILFDLQVDGAYNRGVWKREGAVSGS